MNVIVSDTSVLIDLERGSFLEPILRLPFRYVGPDLLYERELKNHSGVTLVGLGLHVEELDSVGLTLAFDYFQKHKKTLSLPDTFAFVLAKTNSWILLTGDQALRNLAHEEKVKCHGVLWLLDHLYHSSVIGRDTVLDGLRVITEHPRCRLPQSEIKKRIDYLSKSKIGPNSFSRATV